MKIVESYNYQIMRQWGVDTPHIIKVFTDNSHNNSVCNLTIRVKSPESA